MNNAYLKKIMSVVACAVLSAVFIVVMYFCAPKIATVPETSCEITYTVVHKNEDGTRIPENITKKSGEDFTAIRISDLGRLNKITKVNYVADEFVQPGHLNADLQIVDLTKPFEFAEKGTLIFIVMNLDSWAEDFYEQSESLSEYKIGDYWNFTLSLPKIFCASNVYQNANLVASHGKIENYDFIDYTTSYDKKTDEYSAQTENTLIDLNFYTRRGIGNNVYITVHYQSSGGVFSGLTECPFIGTKDEVKSINDNSQNLLLALAIFAVVVFGVLIVLSILKHTKEFIPAVVWIFGITLLLFTRFLLREVNSNPLFWTAAWLMSSFVIIGGALLSIGRNFGKVRIKYVFPTLAALGALLAFISPFVSFGAFSVLKIVCTVLKAICTGMLFVFVGLSTFSKNNKDGVLNIGCAAIIAVSVCASLFMPQVFPVQINPIFWLCAVTIVATFISVFMIFRETEKANNYLTANLHLEVDRQVKDIRAVIDERDKLLQFVSHDMKKPLASAVTLSDTAIARENDVEQIKTLQIIRQSCERVVGNLSEISQFAKFNYIAEPSQVVDISKLCALLYKYHELDCNANGIVLKNLADKPVKAFVKSQGLENVVTNLIINAIEHANCSTVTLSVKPDKNKVVLCVADDGKGIPPDMDVFNPYVSENSCDDEKIDTSGVGLYICKNIIESMNGTLTYESKHGGTIFFISLLKA